MTSPGDRPSPRAASGCGLDRYLGLVLLGSGALLVAGWLLPVMTIRTLLVFYDEVSILEGGLRLLESGDYLLFLLIMTFTVVFPVCKLTLAFLAWSRLHAATPRLSRALGWIEALGKWSMLDVFVIALLVVVIKISLISDVVIHVGLYIFAAAVVLSMLAVKRVAVLAQRAVKGDDRR